MATRLPQNRSSAVLGKTWTGFGRGFFRGGRGQMAALCGSSAISRR